MKQVEFSLNASKEKFVHFLAKTKEERGMTQKDFAREIKVSEQTLCEWKRRDEVRQKLLETVRANSVLRAPEIFDALEKKAMNGDVRAIKLWFDMVFSGDNKSEVHGPIPILYEVIRGSANL